MITFYVIMEQTNPHRGKLKTLPPDKIFRKFEISGTIFGDDRFIETPRQNVN